MKINNKKTKTALRIVLKIILCVVFYLHLIRLSMHQVLNKANSVTGTQNLVDAVISWLTGIGITICGGYFIYYVYCLKTNDEGERRRNMQNIKTTLIAMVLITCGLALVDVILGFYK